MPCGYRRRRLTASVRRLWTQATGYATSVHESLGTVILRRGDNSIRFEPIPEHGTVQVPFEFREGDAYLQGALRLKSPGDPLALAVFDRSAGAAVIDVAGHKRHLGPGRHPSPEARKRAEQLGFALGLNETWVRPRAGSAGRRRAHLRLEDGARPQRRRLKCRQAACARWSCERKSATSVRARQSLSMGARRSSRSSVNSRSITWELGREFCSRRFDGRRRQHLHEPLGQRPCQTEGPSGQPVDDAGV